MLPPCVPSPQRWQRGAGAALDRLHSEAKLQPLC